VSLSLAAAVDSAAAEAAADNDNCY
jgi:hypothetical protein